MAACAPAERTELSWRIEFACEAEASRAQRVMAKILENDCEAPGALRYEAEVTRGGDSVVEPEALPPGPYAFSASAVDSTGAEIASACVSIVLPSSTPVSVTLFGSPACSGEVVSGADAETGTDAACGAPDADEDMTPDCDDGCPADAQKVLPGACGCGVSDADTDKDGTSDCNDGCPVDANKAAPGACGCGQGEGTCSLTLNNVLGAYERRPIENGWHAGRIEQTTTSLVWSNNAGVTWTLIPDLANQRLLTTSDCFYHSEAAGKEFLLVQDNGRVTGFRFMSEFYTSQQ